jgi:hypothetical protein
MSGRILGMPFVFQGMSGKPWGMPLDLRGMHFVLQGMSGKFWGMHFSALGMPRFVQGMHFILPGRSAKFRGRPFDHSGGAFIRVCGLARADALLSGDVGDPLDGAGHP